MRLMSACEWCHAKENEPCASGCTATATNGCCSEPACDLSTGSQVEAAPLMPPRQDGDCEHCESEAVPGYFFNDEQLMRAAAGAGDPTVHYRQRTQRIAEYGMPARRCPACGRIRNGRKVF